MAYNAVFPTSATLINQSVTQIQANWAWIRDTIISQDHYFLDNADPTNGHHRFSQYVDQAGDPPIAAGVAGVVYVKTTAGGMLQPFYENNNGANQIPTSINTLFALAIGPNNVLNFAAFNSFAGLFLICDAANPNSCGTAIVFWNTITLKVVPLNLQGNITAITAVGANLSVTSTSVMLSQLHFTRSFI